MNHDDFRPASDFVPYEGEANFPPTLAGVEVVGGAHIAPEIVTLYAGQLLMIEWPSGLPRHETNRTVRFPHGLMRFGESIMTCAQRLVLAQTGLEILQLRVVDIDSYVDEADHWHIEPIVVVRCSGRLELPPTASRFIQFSATDPLPEGSLWEFGSLSEALTHSALA